MFKAGIAQATPFKSYGIHRGNVVSTAPTPLIPGCNEAWYQLGLGGPRIRLRVVINEPLLNEFRSKLSRFGSDGVEAKPLCHPDSTIACRLNHFQNVNFKERFITNSSFAVVRN